MTAAEEADERWFRGIDCEAEIEEPPRVEQPVEEHPVVVASRFVFQKFDRYQEARISRVAAQLRGNSTDILKKLDREITHALTLLEDSIDELRTLIPEKEQ